MPPDHLTTKLSSQNSPANEPKPRPTTRIYFVTQSPPFCVGSPAYDFEYWLLLSEEIGRGGTFPRPTGGTRPYNANRGISDRVRRVSSSVTTHPSSRGMVHSHIASTQHRLSDVPPRLPPYADCRHPASDLSYRASPSNPAPTCREPHPLARSDDRPGGAVRVSALCPRSR